MTPLRWHVETLRADASPGFTSAGQDRVESHVRGNRVSVALADGAGGVFGGAGAAEKVVRTMLSGTFRQSREVASALRSLDTLLSHPKARETRKARETTRGHTGESTGIFVQLTVQAGGTVAIGACVGDSVCWCRRGGRWQELGALPPGQPKSLLGRGDAEPRAFEAKDIDALFLASDGLTKYASWPEVAALLDATIDDALRTRALPSPSCAARLIELARLPSGRLRDDISAALLHPTIAFPAKARATFTTSHHTGCKSGAAVL